MKMPPSDATSQYAGNDEAAARVRDPRADGAWVATAVLEVAPAARSEAAPAAVLEVAPAAVLEVAPTARTEVAPTARTESPARARSTLRVKVETGTLGVIVESRRWSIGIERVSSVGVQRRPGWGTPCAPVPGCQHRWGSGRHDREPVCRHCERRTNTSSTSSATLSGNTSGCYESMAERCLRRDCSPLSSGPEQLRNVEGEIDRLLCVQPGITCGRIAEVKLVLENVGGTAQALGHVPACELDVDPAGPGAN